MNILIAKEKSIGDIRKEFSQLYPFLKIEFYKTEESRGVTRRVKLDDEFHLTENGAISIDISKHRSIALVKKDFLTISKLIAQVYRKSGTVWVETSHTDSWSLEHQNFEGEQMNDSSTQ